MSITSIKEGSERLNVTNQVKAEIGSNLFWKEHREWQNSGSRQAYDKDTHVGDSVNKDLLWPSTFTYRKLSYHVLSDVFLNVCENMKFNIVWNNNRLRTG